MQTLRVTVVLAMALLMGACASSNSGGVYQRGEARQIQTVKTGVVESVRQVKLEGTKTPIGGGAGAVVGGLAGAAAEEGLTRKDGIEVTVKLDSGNLIAVVQEADEQFSPGDKVRIVESGGVARVTH